MFTGLIEEKGKIVRAATSAGGLRLSIEAPKIAAEVAIGDSVSVNGVCLTIVAVRPPVLEFDAVRETVERSTVGMLRSGDGVNLERALRVGDRLGGHMVQGHVDGIGVISEIRSLGSEMLFRFDAPPEIMRCVVEKGSIAVDGISLTVAEVGPSWFRTAMIPHTLASTTLGKKSAGDTANLETDIIGKYVYKFVSGGADERLMCKLADGGFLE
jgi:riboflavin synthase